MFWATTSHTGTCLSSTGAWIPLKSKQKKKKKSWSEIVQSCPGENKQTVLEDPSVRACSRYNGLKRCPSVTDHKLNNSRLSGYKELNATGELEEERETSDL